MQPGFHTLNFDEYRALDAVNFHRLSDYRRSPAACWLRMQEPQLPTRPQLLGTALHAAILEPKVFTDTFRVQTHDGRTREGKAERADAEARGLILLNSDEYGDVNGMARSLQTHPRASKLLGEATSVEQSALWQAPQGRLCKARRDLVGPGWIADIKTVSNLDRFSPWTLTELGYYRQAAWYSWAEKCLDKPQAEHFFFLVVVSSPPFESQVFRLTENAMQAGKMENDRLLDLYLMSERENRWPRHVAELGEADVSWARAREVEGVL